MTIQDQFREYLKAPMSLKDLSDWIKVAVLCVGAVAGYVHLMDKVDSYGRALNDLNHQTTRIERYLSSKDSGYWGTVKNMEDSE